MDKPLVLPKGSMERFAADTQDDGADRIYIGNGMFLTPSGNRGVFYCTTTTIAYVRWD